MLGQRLFSAFTETVRYFKQPKKVGDIVELNGKNHLIIGIEDILITTAYVKIKFTTQVLDHYQYAVTPSFLVEDDQMLDVYVQGKVDNPDLKAFKLGMTTYMTEFGESALFKLMEYTDVTFDGTDLCISGRMKRVFPIPPKEAKALHLQRRKQQLKLL